MISEHYAAVRALLPADLTVYSGNVIEKPNYPYVIVWGNQGVEDSESLGEHTLDLMLRINVTCVGLSFDSVLITIDRTRRALNRAVPRVAGRAIGPLRQSYVMGIHTDEAVTVPGKGHPMYAVDQYSLYSTPA